MEHKQLNFDQPILSVRRYSTTTTPPAPSVKTEKCKNDTSFPSLPSLPYYRSELKSGPVSNPGTVPFTWERSPGRPKDDANHPHFKNHSAAPKLPPGWTLNKQAPVPSSRINEDNGGSNPEDKFEESKDNEGINSSDSVSNSESNGVHDEVYLDALDTLSRTESYFLNCSSMNGFSEKPAGAFSADPQTRDFMMGRFLPAAKAMAAEIPQSSKKQNFPREQPSRKEKEKPVPVVRPKSSNVPTYMEYHKEVESKIDEEDDYYDEPENLPNKACGLLPRFCLKSSFCLLNPLPGMSTRTRVPMSPVSSVQTRSSLAAGLCCKSEDQPTGQVSTYEQKRVNGFGATEKNGHVKLDGSPQPSFSDSEEFHAISGAMNNEFHDSHSGEKKLSSLQELFADPCSSFSEETGIITNLTVEKTVYVDSVHKMAATKSKSKSCSSDEEIPKSLKEEDTHSLKDCEEDSNNNTQSLVKPAEGYSYSRRSTFSTNTKTQSHLKQELLSDAKNTPRFNPKFPLPPPLPKSPSESWLFQALPAISKSSLSWKNHLASQTDLQSMASKVPPVDPKWETLVKMKKIQHQY